MSERHLKSHQYYADLYDRFTVENCRRIEQRWSNKNLEAYKDEDITEKQVDALHEYGKEMQIHFETGERYLKRSATIQEWIDRDTKKDDLYENAKPPEDIRCLTCRNKVKVTFKTLWDHTDKEDRVLFMFDCQNGCLPRRAFFSDGEEYRTKPNLCPQCGAPLNHTEEDDGKKAITTYTCSKCSYTKKDEYEWSHKKEEDIDLNFAKDRDRFCLTEEEGQKYQKEKWGLEGIKKLMDDFHEEEKRREDKLKGNPKGFILDGKGYTCAICHNGTPEGDCWYDEYGIKCLVCQNAIDVGEIPASLAKDKDSWYTKYDLESYFNLKGPKLRSWIKQGIIKPRIVSHYGKGSWYELFMIEDNKDFLPPKKMLESQYGYTEENGKKERKLFPWYCFVNPVEYLKGYKIMDHMRVLTPEEVKARDEEQKKKDEQREAKRLARREIRLKNKGKSDI